MRTFLAPLILLALLAAFHGCQNSTTTPNTPAAPQGQAAAPAANPAAPPAAAPVDPAHPEMKWIGKIPYDVFYDQPLTVAADSTVVATVATNTAQAAPAPTASAPMTSTATPAPAAAPAAGATDWNQLAPMSAIVDEVKQTRGRLEKNLLKVGDFNKNTAVIGQDGALLAAIGAVVAKHPGEVNWKDKANFIRDLGYQINNKAEGSGSKPYTATKTPFEDIKRLLDGEAPSGTAKDDVPLAEVADRAALMAKLNTKYESVKSNVNSAGRLKEEKDRVLGDLAIMNLLMTVMADHSYDQADDPRYAGYVQTMLNDQKAAIEAANSDNFDAYTAAVGKINNTCNECHMIFRTGSN